MRERLPDLIGKPLGRVRFLGFQNLVEIVVGNSDRNLGLAVWNPELRICSLAPPSLELGFKSLYLNPTAHERGLGVSVLIGLHDGGFLDAAFS
jgi:hypothetical protein